MSFEYHRPQSIEEAVELLRRGVPLAGGTVVTPARRKLHAVVDIQDLGLDGLSIGADQIECGAALTLQSLVEKGAELPQALIQAVRLEAGWNIRNQATIAGAIEAADGRSPLMTVLLAMQAELEVEPGGMRKKLSEHLTAEVAPISDPKKPRGLKRGSLITVVHLRRPAKMLYEQVARSPADRPQVCVAVALHQPDNQLQVALGGYADRPILLPEVQTPDAQSTDYGSAAGRAYADATDQWASGEFREAAASALTRRLIEEILAE